MSVGFPVTSSAFHPHKTMNNESFLNQNPNTNLLIQRQIGIVSLLGSDTGNNTTHHSIKRTLSADMSSPKWLHNNGFTEPSLKRAQSSDRLSVGVEEEEVNKHKFVNEDEKKGAFEDIWSSILSQKGSGSGQLPPPYVHPMVKRTTSSLSEKSLEICTESLGSETGSDGFSFPVSSEPDDTDKDSETTEDQHVEHVKETPICGPHNDEVNELGHVGFAKGPVSPTPSLSPSPSPSLSLGPRLRSSFPPPLPSLANRNGSNVHMRSHRQNGRLVLEAVAVPSQNCFKAQRHDGRLLLTLAGGDDDDDEDDDVESCKDDLEQEEDVSVVHDDDELEDIDCGDEDQEEEEQEVVDKVVEDGESCFPMEIVNVQQATPGLIMSKFKWLNITTPRNDNATFTNNKAEVDQHKSLLPPRPKMARVISKDGQVSTATTNSILNAYEYYWRQSKTAMAVLKPLAGQHQHAAPQVVEKESNYMSKLLPENNHGKSNYSRGQDKQEVVIVKAMGTRAMKGDQREKEGEYLVPFLRGCKESKRSLLLWEPHCIATS